MKALTLVLLLTLFSTAQAFTELKSYSQFQLPESNKQTWVIFDIDNTLIRPKSEIGSHQWADYMAKRYQELGHSEAEAKEYQPQIFSRAQAFVEPILVDSYAPTFLKKLESKKIPFFTLTARGTNLHEITLKQLSTNSLLSFFEHNHPAWNADMNSYTQKGVVFSNGLSKGDILKKLVTAAVIKPERVIFIDDRDYNVISIEKAANELGLEVIGLRFSATDEIVASLDSKKADAEWMAAKYLNSQAFAKDLHSAFDLGRALFKNDYPMLLPYSEHCRTDGGLDIIKVSCDGEETGYYGDPQIVKKDYLVKFEERSGVFVRDGWDMFGVRLQSR